MSERGAIGEETVTEAAEVVRRGGVLVYPTDTIYGLGCDAFNGKAIERVFSIKGRPEDRPVLLLIGDRKMLAGLTEDISALGERLVERFWPGPLTILFRARPGVNHLLTGREGKVGVRLPDSDFCRRLLERVEGPIVSTSANISGKEGTQKVGELRKELGGLVDLFIDGGPPASTVPSTVVDVTGETIRIVREGAVPSGELLRVVAS